MGIGLLPKVHLRGISGAEYWTWVTRSLCLFVMMGCLCGCQSVRFYAQAVRGQAQILTHRQSIDRVVAETNTPPEVREKLKCVQEIRQFASKELHLPGESFYKKYADIHRPFVVWIVTATPELSLEPHTWWYLVIGRASYRGFFSERAARNYAKQLEKEGLDVYVGGVETYSTLGWFEDPILNTFIDESEEEMAETLFHELAHHKVYISGGTDFNEAFATAVAREGMRRWFEAKHQPRDFKHYREVLEHDEAFTKLIMTTVRDLNHLYTNPSLSIEAKREGKQKAFRELRARFEALKKSWGVSETPYDAWFSKPLNNARLSSIATYNEWVPAFEAMLKANGGDLEKFYTLVKRLGKMPNERRIKTLKAYMVTGREPVGETTVNKMK